MKISMLAILALAALAVPACDPVDHCRVNDTRCNGSTAQICGSDERWRDVMNCDQISSDGDGRWSCQSLDNDKGHACLPVEEDAAVDAAPNDGADSAGEVSR